MLYLDVVRLSVVNESFMLADDMPTSYFGLFHLINDIVTDVNVTKVSCY